ncbi:SPOR domain-containing protein, partial [Luteimonas sp. Y-2-2-4F]
RLVGALPIAAAQAGDRPAPAAPPAAAQGERVAPAGEWRFDMHQNGRAMTADEFDAWMKARQIRVATGRPGTPEPRAGEAPAAAAATPTVEPARAAAVAQASVPAAADAVVLQIAAFGARDNAERALSMLRGAGLAQARVVDGTAGGKPVYRLRVGPVATHQVAELSARCAGLGFGQPQVVRE